MKPEDVSLHIPLAATETALVALDDTALVVAAQAGNSGAFDETMRRYQLRVYRTAFGIVRNSHDAEDVVQEVFVNVLKHLPNFRHDSAFSTWITRIAINTSLMHLRRTKRERCVSYDAPEIRESTYMDGFEAREPSADELIFEHQKRLLLADALKTLSTSLRSVTADRLQNGALICEIASRQGISISAAKSRLLRARTAITQALRPATQLRA